MHKYFVFVLVLLSGSIACQRIYVTDTIDANKSYTKAEQSLQNDKREELASITKKYPAPIDSSDDRYAMVNCYLEQIAKLISGGKPKHLQSFMISIIPTDDLIARSFPPNIIILSSSLLNQDSPCGAPNESALVGILAHELCHLWFAHTEAKYKWQTLNNDVKASQMDSILASGLTFISPIGISRTTIIPSNLPDAVFAEWYLESVADLFALKCLTALDFNPTEYQQYLETIKNGLSTGSCHCIEGNVALAERIERIKRYADEPTGLSNSLPPRLHFAVLNGTGLATYKLSSYDEIRSLLAKGNLSPKYLELVRSINYWDCAVMQNDKWKQELLMVPIYMDDKPMKNPETGKIFFAHGVSIPLEVNGLESFVFSGYPNLFKELKENFKLGR